MNYLFASCAASHVFALLRLSKRGILAFLGLGIFGRINDGFIEMDGWIFRSTSIFSRVEFDCITLLQFTLSSSM